MIFINLENFLPTDEWSAEAQLLNEELMSKQNLSEKYQFIDNNRGFWGRIKQQLPLNDKCWYSESKESVSVYEIEHFRPTRATMRCKSVLKTLKSFIEEQRIDWVQASRFKGSGYWWLAFTYTNYRNCGKKVNNKKGVRFPIKEKSFVAYNTSDDYETEENILLDPTKENDPDLLTFDPDGKARPVITDPSSFEYLRVYVSIDVYGLNSIETLVKHREAKWSECRKAIKRAIDKYTELETAASQGNKVQFDRYFNEFMDFVDNDIKPAIDPSSEFSAVAKACVRSYSKYSWVNEYILNN